jgi:hypothetical protein
LSLLIFTTAFFPRLIKIEPYFGWRFMYICTYVHLIFHYLCSLQMDG